MKRRKFSREFKIEESSWSANAGFRWRRPAATWTVMRMCCASEKKFGSGPVQAFPRHGQMKPEQQEIERLRREVAKLKAAFVAKHRTIWPHGCAMRWSVAVRLPCLAEPLSQRQIPQRRGARRQGQGQLRRQRPHLWRTPGVA
nr:transposase and inactivated derivatives [Bradyrhizobium sp. DOA9]